MKVSVIDGYTIRTIQSSDDIPKDNELGKYPIGVLTIEILKGQWMMRFGSRETQEYVQFIGFIAYWKNIMLIVNISLS